jgi:LacI family transcriptional regulator
MRDVASAASVSVKTVSRVVHNYPFISDDVRGRVQAEIRRLGFRPNSNAVGLRRTDRPAGGIGVLAADLADPFYAGMLSAIEQVSTARSFTTLVASSDEDPARERGLLGTFVERRLDGLIVVSADRRHDHLRPELDVGTRIVFADRPPQRLPVDCVLAAHAEGAGQAVAHLLGQGHRAIAYVGHSPVIHTARERLRGFRAALADAGLEPHAVRTDAVDAAAAHRAAAELLAAAGAPTASHRRRGPGDRGVRRAADGAGRLRRLGAGPGAGRDGGGAGPPRAGPAGGRAAVHPPRRRPFPAAARDPADHAGAARLRRGSRGRAALSRRPQRARGRFGNPHRAAVLSSPGH